MQTIIGKNIITAKHLLENGKLVAIPTETVYGLAANALEEAAVIKIFNVKNRPKFNPLIVHIKNWNQIDVYAKNIPEKAHLLANKLSPGPITFLLHKKDIIPDLITSGSNLVAIRIPNHPLTLELLAQIDFPLAAPSANEFGYISPTLASHVMDSLGGKIEYILDGGAATIGLESTIVGFDENENVIIHRVGGISIETIEGIIQEKVVLLKNSTDLKPQTSGQLKSHYAPHTELIIGDIEFLAKKHKGKKIVSINFKDKYLIKDIEQYVLSESGNLDEASTQLFSTLRKIDKLEVDLIITELFPNEGLGKAINDRLSRAQGMYKPS